MFRTLDNCGGDAIGFLLILIAGLSDRQLCLKESALLSSLPRCLADMGEKRLLLPVNRLDSTPPAWTIRSNVPVHDIGVFQIFP